MYWCAKADLEVTKSYNKIERFLVLVDLLRVGAIGGSKWDEEWLGAYKVDEGADSFHCSWEEKMLGRDEEGNERGSELWSIGESYNTGKREDPIEWVWRKGIISSLKIIFLLKQNDLG